MASDVTSWVQQSRVIFYHKNDISALLLFLRNANESVCAPLPLPTLSAVLDKRVPPPHAEVQLHPSAVVRQVCATIGLPVSLIKADGDYRQQVDTPKGLVDVYLARFHTAEAPHALVREHGARFLPLAGLRGRPPAELELLRRAYVSAMEG